MISYISINTNKSKYKPKENVQIKIINNSDQIMSFLDSDYGLLIYDKSNNIIWSLNGTKVITSIEKGGSRIIEWNQCNKDNKQVPIGKYIVSVKYYMAPSAILYNEQTEFEIIN